jgi:hypothetical protein
MIRLKKYAQIQKRKRLTIFPDVRKIADSSIHLVYKHDGQSIYNSKCPKVGKRISKND